MEIWYIVVVCLALAILWLSVALYQKRQQMFLFSAVLKQRQEEGSFTPLTVKSFSADVVELANQLNAVIANQREMHRQAVQSEAHMKQMIAGISHDFRTPLTAVLGYLQMMEQGGRLTAQDLDSLKIVQERCRHLYALADDFFEVSRICAQDGPLETEPVDLTRLLIEECLLAHDWMQQRQIEAVLQIPEEPFYVLGQAHALKRVIENLLSNVRKYAKDTVWISLREKEEEIVLSFANNMDGEAVGSKSAADFGAHVFEPFYRLESRSGQGSGLGLYVVKCLAEKMGGHVSADCEKDRFCVAVGFRKTCIDIPA